MKARLCRPTTIVLTALVAALSVQPMRAGAALGPRRIPKARGPASQWSKFHYDLASTGFNPFETILSRTTVESLTVKWAYRANGGVTSAPAIVDAVAYSATGGGDIFAVDAATGTLVWMQHRGIGPSDVTVADGMVFVGTISDDRLYAFDAVTGEERWSTLTVGSARTPLVMGGTVYVATSLGQLYALSAADGTPLWKVGIGGEIDNGIAASGRYLYVGDAVGCSVRAVDKRNGAVKWSTCVGDQIPGTPTVAGGKVFVGARDGRMHALDAKTGQELWTGDLGDESFSSAAAAYGLVYIGSTDGNLYAFAQDCTTPCTPIWTFQTGDDLIGESPIVANGVVYTGSTDNTVYALDAMTGAQLWSYRTHGYFGAPPALLDGVLYVNCFDHNLYAFSLPAGT